MPRAGHSHHRLFVAMGASAGLLAALLWALNSLIRFVDCDSQACLDEQAVLTVHLENKKDKTIPLDHVPERPARVPPPVEETADERQLAGTGQQEVVAEQVEVTDLSEEVAPRQDWYAIAKETAAHVADERVKKEESREHMWRQTRSVMFADTGEFDVHEPAPIIADLEFKVPVGVLGVGITIGGCFIGIPLAGIPVEERTAAPTVIYCKDRYE